ncbi:hypothetical protein CDAR_113611 [Caerostris darwini]|uniref:Uncharacterized protein n=1 Tax=Caerostris darwini TaxID=1538125 RepID=A0AAV4NM73_9ARAC|nr:hypothetical protein CDAR_113611 [Caerostris darwini]
MKITFSSPGRITIPVSIVKMSHRDREGGGVLLTTFLEFFAPFPIPYSSRNEVCPSGSRSEDFISLRRRVLTWTNAICRSRECVAYLLCFLLFAEFAVLCDALLNSDDCFKMLEPLLHFEQDSSILKHASEFSNASERTANSAKQQKRYATHFVERRIAFVNVSTLRRNEIESSLRLRLGQTSFRDESRVE